MPLNIFLTGSTGKYQSMSSSSSSTISSGYIGGSVLNLLLSHPLYNTFQITVVIRDPAKENKFRSLGVKTALGSNSDHSLLQHLAYEADVVIACVSLTCLYAPSTSIILQADADDVGAAKAILSGLKRRFERTGVAPSLIHTVSPPYLLPFSPSLNTPSLALVCSPIRPQFHFCKILIRCPYRLCQRDALDDRYLF